MLKSCDHGAGGAQDVDDHHDAHVLLVQRELAGSIAHFHAEFVVGVAGDGLHFLFTTEESGVLSLESECPITKLTLLFQ
jgi:hypothetical protein